MKVIDLSLYRSRKAVELLEKKVGQLVHTPQVGGCAEMKMCFKEWLKIRAK